jgi:hypothetical protein
MPDAIPARRYDEDLRECGRSLQRRRRPECPCSPHLARRRRMPADRCDLGRSPTLEMRRRARRRRSRQGECAFLCDPTPAAPPKASCAAGRLTSSSRSMEWTQCQLSGSPPDKRGSRLSSALPCESSCLTRTSTRLLPGTISETLVRPAARPARDCPKSSKTAVDRGAARASRPRESGGQGLMRDPPTTSPHARSGCFEVGATKPVRETGCRGRAGSHTSVWRSIPGRVQGKGRISAYPGEPDE